jgi:uncharacterized protein YndB with AHSA1/START domain
MGSLSKTGTFRIERRLPGPIERVWEYITDANKRRLWFADGPMVLRARGEVSLKVKFRELTEEPTPAGYPDACEIAGVITECRPPNKLSFTWGREPNASHVTFELSSAGDEVLLVITHVRIADTDERSGIASGWHAHLELLREALGGAKAVPFWTTKLSMLQSYGKQQ